MDRLQALRDAQDASGKNINGLFTKHGSNQIKVDAGEWDEMTTHIDAEKAALTALVPTETDAIRLMHDCYTRLKELGWNDAISCPKDGSTFDAIEAGSTGIHETHYAGDWPDGSWWCFDGGDLWPSRPVLYRVTDREIAARDEARKRFAKLCESADPQGIAECPQS